MVDTGLLTQQLRAKGHTVEHVEAVSENAGNWIFIVDGQTLDLDAARALLEDNVAE